MKTNPKLLTITLVLFLINFSCDEETPEPVLVVNQHEITLEAFTEPINNNLSISWDDHQEVVINGKEPSSRNSDKEHWFEYKTSLEGYMVVGDSLNNNDVFFTLVEKRIEDSPSDYVLLKFVPLNGDQLDKDVGYFNLKEFSGTIYGYDLDAKLSYTLGISNGKLAATKYSNNESRSDSRVQYAPPLPNPCPEPNDPLCQDDGGGGHYETVTVEIWTDWFVIKSSPSGTYGEYVGSEISGYEIRDIWVPDPYPSSLPTHEHYPDGAGKSLPRTTPHPNAYKRDTRQELEKIMQCEELDDQQFGNLVNVLDEYLNAEYLANCLNSQIFDYVDNNNTKLCFKMGNPTGSPGGYSSASLTIYFNSTADIKEEVFAEEFFHVYQDAFYGGIPSDLGRSNIEFEAKLFHDISHPNCCIAFWDGNIRDEYLDWITQMTDWYDHMPTWNSMSAKYYYFLEKFVEEKPEYNYPIDYNQTPEAILNLNDCL